VDSARRANPWRLSSCGHNPRAVKRLPTPAKLGSTPAASIRLGREAVESNALSEPQGSGRVEGQDAASLMAGHSTSRRARHRQADRLIRSERPRSWQAMRP
jgi:hypothetical protein